ncbi:MAG: beta-L-arabinofuranosidase domain-containing protein [Bacteroidales bacterium]
MKYVLSVALLLATAACTHKPSMQDYPYSEVRFTEVHLNDKFWRPRIDTVIRVTIPYAFKKCEETGRVDNFAIAAGLKEGEFCTVYPFDDSDLYKIIEGASYALMVRPDSALNHYLDSLIWLIGRAQEPDGYLYTTRTIGKNVHPWAGKARWENERDNSHELYNMGHLYEAAAAHYYATGKKNLLDIALKNAELLCKTFGPGKREVAPGHQIIETGLVKLYRITHDTRYLSLAKFFLDARGKHQYEKVDHPNQFQDGRYWQDHKPVILQDEAVGHAVRAMYMYSGMTDIAALTGDEAYRSAIGKLWKNVVTKKIYLTGGVGASSYGEAFGTNYELPNKTAYNETCAAIANCMWNFRMFLLYGDAKYIDVLERTLYNGVLSGLSLSGDRFFYPNPLEVDRNGQERKPWFDCSCCPTNLTRFIPSVPGYMYAFRKDTVFINLFAGNETSFHPAKGKTIRIRQQTNYPWDGHILITLMEVPREKWTFKLRIPGWARNQVLPGDLYSYITTSPQPVSINVNSQPFPYKVKNGYAVLTRKWKQGDTIEMTLPMQPLLVKANEKVEEDRNKLAVEYGPLVYCAEFADNDGEVSTIVLPDTASFDAVYQPALLGGVTVLKGKALRMVKTSGNNLAAKETSLNLIPYYARSHRGKGEMSVWLPDNPSPFFQKLREEQRVVDRVLIGNPLSEKEHQLKGVNTQSGGSPAWRHAVNGGWFSYAMRIIPDKPQQLVVTYFSMDEGNRSFQILAENKLIALEKLQGDSVARFLDKKYPLPQDLTKDRNKITIQFKALPGNTAGGIFGCRIEIRE